MMKRHPLTFGTLVAGVLWLGLAAGHSDPVLRYEFNHPGSVQNSTGSSALAVSTINSSAMPVNLIAEAPVQRSGSENAYALNFTAEQVGAPNATNYTAINAGNAPFLTTGLGSFTVTAWLLDFTPASTRRLFYLSGGSTVAIDLRLTEANRLQLSVGGSTALANSSSSVTVPTGSNTWHFVAVSYDADTGLASFYTGPDSGSLVSSSQSILDGNGDPYTLPINSTSLNIGNSARNGNRRVDAYFSDFRFYDSALDAREIEAIHAIPEPTTALLLIGSLAVAFSLRYRSGAAR